MDVIKSRSADVEICRCYIRVRDRVKIRARIRVSYMVNIWNRVRERLN